MDWFLYRRDRRHKRVNERLQDIKPSKLDCSEKRPVQSFISFNGDNLNSILKVH